VVSFQYIDLFSFSPSSNRTSATNCARIYNLERPLNNLLPVAWATRLELDCRDVWNAFFLHSLLEDHAERHSTLQLPHQASSQDVRIREALRARNLRMVGPGQEEWNHACDMCCWVTTDDEGIERRLQNLLRHFFPSPYLKGQVRSTVTDGVTLGRPCCGVQDCFESLRSINDRFCVTHADLNRNCAVTSCSTVAEEGFRTCAVSEHRSLENRYLEQGKAMFQLKRRLERSKLSQTHDSLSTGAPQATRPAGIGDDEVDGEVIEGPGVDDAEVTFDEGGICDGKPESGNRPIRAMFGRRRTHNKELCVASCGVILGRATCYGSEAPNGVRVSLCHSYLSEIYSNHPSKHVDILDDTLPNEGFPA
jgi:hypothetical protein